MKLLARLVKSKRLWRLLSKVYAPGATNPSGNNQSQR